MEFLGYKQSSQVLKCPESVEEREEVRMRARGWGVQWWLPRDQLRTAAVRLCGSLRSAPGHMQRAGGTGTCPQTHCWVRFSVPLPVLGLTLL